jgi:hypothetical protein
MSSDATGNTEAASSGPPAVSRQEARAREEDFIARLLRNVEAVKSIPNPVEGKVCELDPYGRVQRWDRKRLVKDLMVKKDVFDRSLLGRIPLNRGVRVEAGPSGLFSGFKPRVSVIGFCLSPLEAFIEQESSTRTVTYAALEEGLSSVLDATRDFHFVGVFAPTGFSPECRGNVPSGRNYACLLLEKGDRTEWKTHGGAAAEWKGASVLYELETPEEMLDRAEATLRSLPDLGLKGGHVQLERARDELGFPREVFDEAVQRLVDGSEEFLVRQFDGVKILQRSRF